jgi:hypothetical protein
MLCSTSLWQQIIKRVPPTVQDSVRVCGRSSELHPFALLFTARPASFASPQIAYLSASDESGRTWEQAVLVDSPLVEVQIRMAVANLLPAAHPAPPGNTLAFERGADCPKIVTGTEDRVSTILPYAGAFASGVLVAAFVAACCILVAKQANASSDGSGSEQERPCVEACCSPMVPSTVRWVSGGAPAAGWMRDKQGRLVKRGQAGCSNDGSCDCSKGKKEPVEE